MLSDFVRGRFLVVGVLIALFAGLAFFGDYSMPNSGQAGSQNCFIKVYNRCYRLKETQRLAQFYALAYEDLFLFEFASALFGEERLDGDPTDFVMGLIVLRKEARKLGVEPTEEEVAKAVPNLRRFQLSTNIDEEYVVNNFLGPRGLSKGDLYQLVKDYLSWQRIQDLLASGYSVPDSEVEKQYIRNNQQFTASLADFERAEFLEKVEITDKDLQDYYDAKKDSLKTEESRAFTLIKFSPPVPAEGMTEEQKALQADGFPNLVQKIWSDLTKNPDEFDDTAAATLEESKEEGSKSEMGPVEVKTIEAFPATSPPEELEKLPQVLGTLFSSSLTLDRPVTLPLQQEDGSFLVYKLTEDLPETPMSFEEAKEQIRTAVKGEKSGQLAQEAASAARGKVAEALEAGKSIEEAAAAAGIELKPLDPFSATAPPKGIEDPNALIVAALKLQPQSVSEVIQRPLGKGYSLLLVDKIELLKSDDAERARQSIRETAETRLRRSLFQAWFNRVRNESGAQRARSIPAQQPDPDPDPAPAGQPASS